MSQNSYGSPPSQSDLEDWADRYGMTDIPVLGLTADDASRGGIGSQFEVDGYIPTVFYIGPDMTVLAAESYASPDAFLD